MRKVLLVPFGLALLVAPDARAQGVVCALGPMTPNYSSREDQPAATRAAKDLERISTLLCPEGCGRVHLFRNATTPNILAMNVGNGNSKIVYSQAFLDRVRSVYGPDASFGVLAHEFGHHVDQTGSPVAWMDPSWNVETRADAWAGCALARAGLKTEGLKRALLVVSSPGNDRDPIWDVRWSALRQGYGGCGGGLKQASAKFEPSSAKLGGCASNLDCRSGRACEEGRCRDGSLGNVCLKDVDCPENQICTTAGHCDGAAPAGRFTPSVAVVTQAKGDALDCRGQCDADRRLCRISAARSLNDCLARVKADPDFAVCACPNWPSAKPECRALCETGFEQGERCESEYGTARETCLSDLTLCSDCSAHAIETHRRAARAPARP